MSSPRPNVQITFANVEEPLDLSGRGGMRGPWWLWAVAVIALVSVWPSMVGTFLPQDDLNVTENIFLRSYSNLRAMWRFAYSDLFPQFSPLGYSAYLFEYRIWGGVAKHAASGYRLVNLLLHIGNVMLLWTLLRKLDVRGAFVAAGVFAAHPVQVQTVAWISQQPMLIGTMFALMSLIVYLRFCGLNPEPYVPGALRLPRSRWVLYALATMLFALAIVAKPALAVLPVIIVNMIWWERGRITFRDLRPLAPWLVAMIGTFVGAVLVFHHSTQIQEQHLSVLERIAVLGPAVWFYLYELIRPGTFSFAYPRWNPLTPWSTLMLVAVFGAIVYLWNARRRMGRGPVVAAMSFTILLLPHILFVDLAQSRDSFISDSAMYAAMAAIVVSVGAGATEMLLPRGRELSVAAPAAWLGAAAIVLAASLSFSVARSYTSAEALWTATIARTPNSTYALNQLGVLEMKAGRFNDAFAHVRRAIEIDPNNSRSHRNMGMIYEAGKEFDRAYAEYLFVLHREPRDVAARCGLARSLAAQGNRAAALQQYQIALKYRPEYDAALNDMAEIYSDLGNYDAAVECYQRAIRASPRFIPSYVNFARLLFRMRRLDDAFTELNIAATIDPTNFIPYANFGAMCAQESERSADPKVKRKWLEQSERAFRNALYHNPQSAVCAFNLAKALTVESNLTPPDAGKMKEAVFYFAKANQLDPDNIEYKRWLDEIRAKDTTSRP